MDADIDVRLRSNYVNLYFRGRSLARIVGRSRHPAKLEIHHKYVLENQIGEYTGHRTGDYVRFDVDGPFAVIYADHLDALIKHAQRYVGPEEVVEEKLLKSNDSKVTVCCFDRQIQVPRTRRTLDLLGLLSSRDPTLVAIEVKRYPDSRIQHVSQQLHDYLEILDPKKQGLRTDVARSYRKVCKQLRALGLPAPHPAQITSGMRVEGLVIVYDYEPRSRLLARAHKLATNLERPIYLWQPKETEHVIPAAEQWQRMGRSES